MTAAEIYSNPLFGVTTTIAAYVASQALHRRWPRLHPLLPTCGVLIAMLLLARIPYASYKHGGDLITFFLGPATVALGVPLYKQSQKIRGHVIALLTAILAGSVSGILSAALFVRAFHGSRSLLLSMIPKSVTTPISMEISRLIGGEPDLTAVFTVIAGLIGSVIGPRLLRRLGVRNDLAIGAAMGTSSHGIGTARVIRESELQGGVAGLAMAMAGIFTSLLAIPLYWWVRR
ncbi:MAG TPA: LrgB family protein [Tepidisphaeraceae bacterium]|jgi:predicted murein hydrolase (TIGR00659 family)|nr:LrgB family protein [Tepidisphaeraceae bacterium]